MSEGQIFCDKYFQKRESLVREQIGEALVLKIFKTLSDKMVVGIRITKGKVLMDSIVKIIRNKDIITMGKITNIQSGKENVNEVSHGEECGIEFSGEPLIKPEDILEIYTEKDI